MSTPADIGNQFGQLCPACKSGESLSVQVLRFVTLTPDGCEDETYDSEWEDTSPAKCSCGWTGTVADFNTAKDFEED